MSLALATIAQELKILLYSSFWSLDWDHNFERASYNTANEQAFQQLTDLLGGNPRSDLLTEKMAKSTGLTTVTLLFKPTLYHPQGLEIHEEDIIEEVTYQYLADLIRSVQYPWHPNQWVKDITADEQGRLVISLV